MDNANKEPLTKAVHKNPPGKVKIFYNCIKYQL